jgi:hypothetical protein
MNRRRPDNFPPPGISDIFVYTLLPGSCLICDCMQVSAGGTY